MPHSCGRTHALRRIPPVAYEEYQPSHDEIAKLAHSYWEERKGREGSAMEDWLRAERELKIRNAR